VGRARNRDAKVRAVHVGGLSGRFWLEVRFTNGSCILGLYIQISRKRAGRFKHIGRVTTFIHCIQEPTPAATPTLYCEKAHTVRFKAYP
jgi:hypothetical protein